MPANRDTDMTQGNIFRQLLFFALPMTVGLLFQQLYNTVDTLVVGKFVGKEALAAVGCTGNIINVLVGFCAGLGTGASVVISQAYGAHDRQRLHNAVHTTVAVTLMLSVLATVAGILLVPVMLRFMSTPEDVFESASVYLRIYFSGLLGLLVYNVGSSILRAVGDSRRPLYFLIFSALLNTVLDVLFVVALGWGVSGVAWATVISQFLSAILSMAVLTRSDADYSIHWRRLCLEKETLCSILSLGLPSAIQSALTSFSNVFVQGYINQFGSGCMAGWSTYSKLDSFVSLPMQAIGLSSTTFVGQNWGGGNRKRIKQGVRTALLMSVIATMVLMAVMFILKTPLLRIFTDSDEVMEYGGYFISVITPFYFFCAFHGILAGALRGIGNATTPTVIMMGSFVVFRQIFLYVTKLMNAGIIAVALAYPMGWILCTVLLIICYRCSKLFRGDSCMVKEIQ